MDYDRIRQLVKSANVSQAAKDSGVPLRTLWRFKAGGTPTLQTLNKLDAWAKGRKLRRGGKVCK